MKKKILLIQPSPYAPDGNVIKKKRLNFVGLSLPLIAALTPEHYEVELIYETIEEIPWHTEAEIVGISSMGHGVHRTIDIAKGFKALGKTVVLGGYMVSLLPEEGLKYADAVFVGDVETSWGVFLSDYETGLIRPVYDMPLTEYSPPLPRYELITNKKIGSFLPVQAGRGCVNHCSFCSVACLYQGRYLKRPVDEVMRDITEVKRLGYNQFLLLDDNIFSDRAYTKALCEAIKPMKMKWMTQCTVTIGDDVELLRLIRDSGCIALSFGLESITQSSLDGMDKPWAKVSEYERLIKVVRDEGIQVSTEMVVGADGDTLESIAATADFINNLKIAVPRFYILTPIPGTLFFHQMSAENRIYNKDIYSYNGAEAVHVPKNMTPEELTEAYWSLYKDVFSYKNIMKRTLFQKGFFKNPLLSVFYLYINLYYRFQILRGITPNII
jgi:radical SAM superfamily enzyme YgiQ (UPF0313 family)